MFPFFWAVCRRDKQCLILKVTFPLCSFSNTQTCHNHSDFRWHSLRHVHVIALTDSRVILCTVRKEYIGWILHMLLKCPFTVIPLTLPWQLKDTNWGCTTHNLQRMLTSEKKKKHLKMWFLSFCFIGALKAVICVSHSLVWNNTEGGEHNSMYD